MGHGLIKIIDGLKEVDFVLSDDGYQPESGVRVHLKNAIEYIEHPTPVLPSVEAVASDYLIKVPHYKIIEMWGKLSFVPCDSDGGKIMTENLFILGVKELLKNQKL